MNTVISEKPVDNLSYEVAILELEQIVAALESGDQTLDDAIRLFERGQSLATHCSKLLDQAEVKIRRLSGDQLVDLNDNPE